MIQTMISGKSFAEHCKWVVDPRYPHMELFRYTDARDGDWVFINRDYIQDFYKRVPFIASKRFIIVLHNSDNAFTASDLQRLLKYTHRIYAINTTTRHPKLTTIPIGFADKHVSFLKEFKHHDGPRDIEIYANFKVATNPEARSACLEAIGDNSAVTHAENRSVPEYYADLCRSKFVLCPEGTGIDTHRVYEALLCGATPVVLRNSLSHLYARLPVCVVDSWTDSYCVPHGKAFSTNIQPYLK